MPKISVLYYSSPIGKITIKGDDQYLYAVGYETDSEPTEMPKGQLPKAVHACKQQLDEYFLGKRTDFLLPMYQQHGTEFQRKVWKQLQCIPYGTTDSYLSIAHSIHNPKAVRAVGQANNRNPFSIIVPCHRVIATNGHLTGYAGGVWRKEWLIKHENSHDKTYCRKAL